MKQIMVGSLLLVAVGLWGIAQIMVKKLSKVESSVNNFHFAILYKISN